NAADWNTFVAKLFEQQAPRLIISDDTDRKNIHPKLGKIVDGVRASAWDYTALAVLENQTRGLAGDTGDFAEPDFIGHKIPDHGDGDLGERFNDLVGLFGLFGMLGHRDSEPPIF